MADHTVLQVVGEPRSFQTQKGGDFLSYKLLLKEHEDGPVELVQKPETPAPKEGDVIAGHIEPAKGDFPPKLKKEQKGGFGGGNSRGSSDSSIEAQVALKAAVEWAIAQPESVKPTTKDIVTITQQFAAAIREAKSG